MGTLHRLVGLAIGLWMSLVGITGAFLVFHKELDTALNRNLMIVSSPVREYDFDCLIETLNRRYDDRLILFFERNVMSDRESAAFGLSRRDAVPGGIQNTEKHADIEVFLDPNTCMWIGERSYHHWIRTIRSFHIELLYPNQGKHAVGILSVFVISTLVAGIVLWLRQTRGPIVRRLRLNFSAPRPRLWRDMHTVLGTYAVTFLLIQAVSGFLICEWLTVRSAIATVTGANIFSSVTMIEQQSAAVPRVSANTARDAAIALYPNSDISWIGFPLQPDGRYSIRLYPKDLPRSRHTRQVEISAGTSRAVMVFDPDLLSGPVAFMNLWMIWIHNGHFFGDAWRVLLAVVGVILASLFPTGLYIWNRKRASRRRG